MSKILTVAWRDFRLTVMRPAFMIAVIGIPILIIGIVVAMVFMMMSHKEPPLVGTIILLTEADDVVDAVEDEFAKAGSAEARRDEMERKVADMASGGDMGMVRPGDLPFARGAVEVTIEAERRRNDAVIERLKEQVRSSELLAAAVITPAVLEAPDPDAKRDDLATFTLYVGEDVDADHTSLIERAIGDGLVAVRASRRGYDPAETRALLSRPRASTSRLLASGGEASEDRGLREIRQMVPMVFFMLLWAACFTAGQHLMMSTIEEKSNRVMEVLLSAVSPMQLMTGKIIGQGGVGLIILLIYSFLGVASLIAFTLMHIVEPRVLIFLVVYFFMAYFMIASIMAAVGSAVSDIREANTLFTPVMIILMLLWGLWLPISADPNGAVATTFSFVPPAIPFAMVLRLAADEPVPLWQVPATILWGYVCVVAMVWMAAKIFRVGVLMYGKPPSPLELMKWVRYR